MENATFDFADINWTILDVQGDRALVLSTYLIEEMYRTERSIYKQYTWIPQYDYDGKKTTWANSELRSWLSNTFLKKAFSAEERACILKSKIVDEPGEYFKQHRGSTTEDYVFCLSYQEMIEYEAWKKTGRAPTRWNGEEWKLWFGNKTLKWRLRTLGQDYSQFVSVDATGGKGSTGIDKYFPEYLRPAMWVDVNLIKDYVQNLSQ